MLEPEFKIQCSIFNVALTIGNAGGEGEVPPGQQQRPAEAHAHGQMHGHAVREGLFESSIQPAQRHPVDPDTGVQTNVITQGPIFETAQRSIGNHFTHM